MAEKINVKKDSDDPVFQYFSGVNEEIFEKLPKQDKRPYVLIGALGFCTMLLFSGLLFFIAGNFTNSVFAKIVISITGLFLINKLHRMIVVRLIHRFNSTKILFSSYMVIISSFFIICIVSNAAPILDFNDSGFETIATDSTTTSAPADTTVISYPDSTTKLEGISDPKK